VAIVASPCGFDCKDALANAQPEPMFVGRLLCAARLPADGLAAARRISDAA